MQQPRAWSGGSGRRRTSSGRRPGWGPVHIEAAQGRHEGEGPTQVWLGLALCASDTPRPETQQMCSLLLPGQPEHPPCSWTGSPTLALLPAPVPSPPAWASARSPSAAAALPHRSCFPEAGA